MLQTLIEFFVTDVIKEMTSFLRRSWNCVAISGTSMCWWIEHMRVWLRHREECEILSRRSVFPRPLGRSHVHALHNNFLVQIVRFLSEEGRAFFQEEKFLFWLQSSYFIVLVRICRKIGHNFRNIHSVSLQNPWTIFPFDQSLLMFTFLPDLIRHFFCTVLKVFKQNDHFTDFIKYIFTFFNLFYDICNTRTWLALRTKTSSRSRIFFSYRTKL